MECDTSAEGKNNNSKFVLFVLGIRGKLTFILTDFRTFRLTVENTATLSNYGVYVCVYIHIFFLRFSNVVKLFFHIFHNFISSPSLLFFF